MNKNIKNLCILSIFAFLLFLSGCSSTKYRPTYKEVQKNTIHEGNYELDTRFFKNHNLPVPEIFNGKKIDYLVARNDTHRKYGYDFFKRFDENHALRFYKDLKLTGYGDNSPYWRWKISLSKEEFFNAISKNLPYVYRARPREVLTLSNNQWKSINISNIGSIKNVEVAGRGKSGIVTYLLITTTKHKYLVAKELNIRKLLRLTKYTTNSKHDIKLYRTKGGNNSYDSRYTVNNSNILPSGYFAIDLGNTVNLYGGGSGHGVGMSQFAAHDLAENYKFGYKEILKRNYPNSKLWDMYALKGISKNIRVGITQGNGYLDHNKVILVSNGFMKIQGAGFKIDVPRHQKIIIQNKGNRLWVSVGGRHRVKTVNPLYISAGGYYITLEGLKKGYTYSPRYRGNMIITPSKTNSKRIRIINEVKIEDYLKQVIPSEMPESFAMEALKAQAVAARTYALSDYLKGRYTKDGFHVKDTVESQVYNNQKENSRATSAISATAGRVLLYHGKPIDAKYFSTSSGFTEASNYVW